jgi:hypothetical protein
MLRCSILCERTPFTITSPTQTECHGKLIIALLVSDRENRAKHSFQAPLRSRTEVLFSRNASTKWEANSLGRPESSVDTELASCARWSPRKPKLPAEMEPLGGSGADVSRANFLRAEVALRASGDTDATRTRGTIVGRGNT